MKRFVDLGNKMVLRDDEDGVERSMAFICYHEFPEDKRIITAVYFCMPHLDAYETAAEIMDEMRVKYPYGEWSIETPPEWCGRPEWLVLVKRGIEDGYKHYDVVGEYTEDAVEYELEHEFLAEAFKVAAGEEFPTQIIQDVMQQVDEQVAQYEATTN